MRHLFAFILLTFCSLLSFGQDRKDLSISVSAGYLNSPYYNNAHSRGFYGVGFDYHIAKRHVLSANYLAGGHDYFDNTLSNTPASVYIVNPKGTNAQATYNTFSISYKYKIINSAKLSVVPGVGAGIMTHSSDYPYTQGTSMTFRTSSWSDLVFPVTLDFNYNVLRHWQLGLTSGFLIHPDYPILALHAGPKLTYVLK
jgi:hypothetical protein